ncbi:MAG: sodium:proton antiporter NhaD [Lentimicrobiaceae bacterium]|nr:sodium:proton antiporter NhaD [Lentimicrobiaceae bacterium]
MFETAYTFVPILMVVIFVLGYTAIATEHSIHVNKTASALLTGVILWFVFIIFSDDIGFVNTELRHHLGEIAEILFFLMGAMTIVETIDSHNGFHVITSRITQTDQRKLLWIISFITFFLSAVLDNLTTTIVMVSLLGKLIKDREQRLFFAGMVVIAANSGGAWSPMGDVTTTMLWIGNQITAGHIIVETFVPSLISIVVPLIVLSLILKGKVERPEVKVSESAAILSYSQQKTMLILGVGGLVFVPIFKTFTHLPPYIGMMLSLGVIWLFTELKHKNLPAQHKRALSIPHSLGRIDMPSILFFLGILLAVHSLQSVGVLGKAADWLMTTVGNMNVVVILIGLLSAIVDNVPIVAAVQGMFDLSVFPTNSHFWTFLAYAAGTGGSALIIGSAAGVAAMGIEKIDFFWYVKKITWIALLGYFAGAGVFILQTMIFG